MHSDSLHHDRTEQNLHLFFKIALCRDGNASSALAFSPSGDLLASSHGCKVNLWYCPRPASTTSNNRKVYTQSEMESLSTRTTLRGGRPQSPHSESHKNRGKAENFRGEKKGGRGGDLGSDYRGQAANQGKHGDQGVCSDVGAGFEHSSPSKEADMKAGIKQHGAHATYPTVPHAEAHTGAGSKQHDTDAVTPILLHTDRPPHSLENAGTGPDTGRATGSAGFTAEADLATDSGHYAKADMGEGVKLGSDTDDKVNADLDTDTGTSTSTHGSFRCLGSIDNGGEGVIDVGFNLQGTMLVVADQVCDCVCVCV